MTGNIRFSGIAFWGSEFLPGDILPDLEHIRQWANKQGLVSDVELQCVTQDTVDQLGALFTADDQLLVLVHLYKDEKGQLNYLEYPFIPVKTLIKRCLEVKLLYWTMGPTLASQATQPKGTSEVKFGFWLDNSTLEYASSTYGTLTTRKFSDLFQALEKVYPIETHYEQVDMVEREIQVDGNVKARFVKNGRLFDVELTHNPAGNEIDIDRIKARIEISLKEGQFKSEAERAFLESLKKDIENGTFGK